MGKSWDAFVPSPLVWAECLRVLKPGGHLVAFAGSRTYDWIGLGVRLAGFEIRDQLLWMYGSGFPKSMNVSKAIDRAAGALGVEFGAFTHAGHQPNSATTAPSRGYIPPAPATDDARTWEGWGTALKPSFEPIVWARKPLNVVPFASILAECSVTMEALLWSISPVKLVEACSASNLAALEEESGSALWTAAAFNTLSSIGMSGVMDMCNSPEAGRTLWNIASSWSAILGESWRRMSTSTTRTETDLITAWKTCASLASLITPESITRDATSHGGIAWNAESAGKGSTVDGWNLTPTPTPTAGALATSEIVAKVSAEIARIAESLLASSEDPLRGSASQRATTRPGVPDHEPIVLARKPLSGTVAKNVLEHGTGAINVDGCRVGTGDTLARASGGWLAGGYVGGDSPKWDSRGTTIEGGRWPANIIHDGSPEVLAVFPDDGDESAARFYYCAKASRAERELGLADFAPATVGDGRKKSIDNAYQRGKTERRNTHCTVKPVSVMRWLTRLVTPPGGVVLDPYTGSGTTGVAAALEGFEFIGCELSPEYVEIARARIAHAREFPAMWEPDYQAPEEVPEEQLALFDLLSQDNT
jgi:SAM-dependent methyltransferase